MESWVFLLAKSGGGSIKSQVEWLSKLHQGEVDEKNFENPCLFVSCRFSVFEMKIFLIWSSLIYKLMGKWSRNSSKVCWRMLLKHKPLHYCYIWHKNNLGPISYALNCHFFCLYLSLFMVEACNCCNFWLSLIWFDWWLCKQYKLLFAAIIHGCGWKSFGSQPSLMAGNEENSVHN